MCVCERNDNARARARGIERATCAVSRPTRTRINRTGRRTRINRKRRSRKSRASCETRCSFSCFTKHVQAFLECRPKMPSYRASSAILYLFSKSSRMQSALCEMAEADKIEADKMFVPEITSEIRKQGLKSPQDSILLVLRIHN